MFILLEAATVVLLQVVSTYVDTRNEELVYIFVVGVFALVMCGCTYYFEFKKEGEEKDTVGEGMMEKKDYFEVEANTKMI